MDVRTREEVLEQTGGELPKAAASRDWYVLSKYLTYTGPPQTIHGTGGTSCQTIVFQWLFRLIGFVILKAWVTDPCVSISSSTKSRYR